MHIDRLRLLQMHLASEALWQDKIGFDMGSVINQRLATVEVAQEYANCHTTACMAGLACIMFGQPTDEITSDMGQELLGLSDYEGSLLFYNMNGFIAPDAWGMNENHDMGHGPCERDLSGITHAEAVKAIDRLIQMNEAGRL